MTLELTADLLTIELEHLLTLPDGRVVEWEALGTGTEPLVWVEGGPGLPAHLARADVVPVLDRFRCHLVNAPGCGRTAPPDDVEGYSAEAHADFFEAVRVALGLGPVTVMGHSWGGLVGPLWAARHPAGVERLIVISGYAGEGSIDADEADAERERALDRFRDHPWFEAAREEARRGVATWGPEAPDRVEAVEVAGFRLILPFYFAEPEEPASAAHIERIRRELRWNVGVISAWDRHDWEARDYRPQLTSIGCPTLVITGEHDWICGPAWNRPLAAAIPGAQYVEIPGIAHLPQYEAPEVFRRLIDDWIERTARDDADGLGS